MADRRALANSLSRRWWQEPDESLHQAVDSVVDIIAARQAPRHEALLRHARLYGDLPILGFGAFSYARVDSRASLGRLNLNVIRNCCNAVTAKSCKGEVRPYFLTSDGDYDLQQRAKKLQQLTEGLFHTHDVHGTTTRCFMDAAVFGTGIVKVFRDGDDVCIERVFPGELQIDDAEGLYGNPRTMYQEKYIDRQVLMELYPDSAEDIRVAAQAFDSDALMNDTTSDLVRVREAWHLPSGAKAKDGKHAITISNCTLLSEKWEKDHFPFAFMHWDYPLLGFWGVGLAEQLMGIQLEINKLLRQIQTAMHLGSTPKCFVQKGSSVNVNHLNNDFMPIIEYIGQKPEYVAPMTTHPEVFAHLDRLYSRAYEITGISQLSASSQKPAALDSGKALETFSDIESERFVRIGKEREKFHVTIATLSLEVAREIADDEKGYEVVYIGKSNVEKLQLKDVDLDTDDYRMQVWPTSMLSATPAGKLRDIGDMLKTQLIDQDEGRRMLFGDSPDLAEYMGRTNALFDEVQKQLQLMIDEGEPQVPDPVMAAFADEAIRLTTSTYLKAKRTGVKEERLDMLRDFNADLADLKGGNAPAAPMAAPGEMPPPGGGPPMPGGPPGPGGPMAPPPGAPPPMSPEAMRQAA